MESKDKMIMCVDCKKEFTHTVADQQQFAERGFTWEPKRCPDCRKARKERNARPRKGNSAYGIAPIGGSDSWGGRGGGGSDRGQRGFRSGGGYGGGGGRHWESGEGGGGGHGGGAPRPSFDAVCATCGQKTTVPFEPTQGRDVYCRDCFQKRKAGGG